MNAHADIMTLVRNIREVRIIEKDESGKMWLVVVSFQLKKYTYIFLI